MYSPELLTWLSSLVVVEATVDFVVVVNHGVDNAKKVPRKAWSENRVAPDRSSALRPLNQSRACASIVDLCLVPDVGLLASFLCLSVCLSSFTLTRFISTTSLLLMVTAVFGVVH